MDYEVGIIEIAYKNGAYEIQYGHSIIWRREIKTSVFSFLRAFVQAIF